MSTEKHTPQDFIPEPCHENWNEMSGDEQRRYCAKCDTHVVNLTGKSTEEILNLRQKNGGKLCGAFRLGPSIARPLALGSGIASLALASCNNRQPELLGVICPPPEKDEPAKKKTPVVSTKPVAPKAVEKPVEAPKEIKPKIEVKEMPPMLMGDICVPPPKPGRGPA